MSGNSLSLPTMTLPAVNSQHCHAVGKKKRHLVSSFLPSPLLVERVCVRVSPTNSSFEAAFCVCVFLNTFTHPLYFPSALCKCAGLFTSLFLSLPFPSPPLYLSPSLSLRSEVPRGRAFFSPSPTHLSL